MKKILVTGADGFTGQYVVSLLQSCGYRVDALQSDLLDEHAVNEEVKTLAPNKVLHLAGLAFVGQADEQAFYTVNLFGTQNLLRAVAKLDTLPEKIVLASSANVYGSPDVGVLDENVCPAPVNHYAISKLAMEHMARTWFDRLPILIARPFNYTGVGQDEKFLIPKIVSHFQRKATIIELGNLDVARDFSDVRMVANVYRHLLECSAQGEVVNICCGVVFSLKQILEMMAKIAGYTITIKINPDFVRANELKSLQGDVRKLKNIIGDAGLNPISLEETLKWMYSSI